MFQTITATWTTEDGGRIAPQRDWRHRDAVLLTSSDPDTFEQFDARLFDNPADLLVGLRFRGGYHAVYVEVATSRGRRQFKFTPDRTRLNLVFGYRYAMGMGTRAKNGSWHNFEYDLGLLAERAEPGIVVSNITAFFVRFAGSLVAAPPTNRPGSTSPEPTPTPSPTATPRPTATPGPTATPIPTPEPPPPTATPIPTPEPPPPTGPVPIGPATRAEAARFLQQATFGPTSETIDELMAIGNYDTWITRQFAMPMSETLPYTRATSNGSANDARHEIWWHNAMREPDQLRQRTTFALSEIFVVSDNDYTLSNAQYGMCSYYDMLAGHVTGNFRNVLTDVTLHPVMGIYLSMLRNQRADPALNIRPDENYARELLQLFTIGPVELRPDGQPALRNGAPVPTYDQSLIQEFARVFTGWNFAGVTAFQSGGLTQYDKITPMWAVEEYHDAGTKTLLAGQRLPSGQSARQDLDAALDNVFAHANVGPFIGRQLIQRFVSSNPSPAYVARVAAVFNDNSSGVRGDIAATVRAVLLDEEARVQRSERTATFGKVKEPLLRLSQFWRALRAEPGPLNPGVFYLDVGPTYSLASRGFGQMPMASPSVFNFFRPSYSPDGTELHAPEMQILTEANLAIMNNEYSNLVFRYHHLTDQYGAVTRINVEREMALGANPPALADHLDELLLAGSMSDAMRSALVDHVESIPADDEGGLTRALEAIFLCVASPAFQLQK